MVVDIFTTCSPQFVVDYKGKLDVSRNGQSPLSLSIIRGNDQVLEALLRKGANPLYRAGFRTPAIWAVIKNRIDLLDRLLPIENINKKQLLEVPLATASRKGHLEIMNWLLMRGANVDGEFEIKSKDSDKILTESTEFSPFYLACANNHLAAAKMLVGWNCETEYFLVSPLVAACDEGHVEIVKYLLANQYDELSQGEALSVACLNHNSRMVELLISHGAPIEDLDTKELEILADIKILGHKMSRSMPIPEVFEVQREHFDTIKNRTKTVEGRKNTPTWQGIRVNDIVRVRCNNEEVLVKVIDIKLYPSLYDYLHHEDINAVMPRRGIVEIYNTYLEFWNREEINQYGIRAFHIKLL